MFRTLALTTLIGVLALVGGTSSETARASSHEGTVERAINYYQFKEWRILWKQRTNRVRANRCYKPLRFHARAWEVPKGRRGWVLQEWSKKPDRNRERPSRCLPTYNPDIIRYVFPAATEGAALAVAWCESAVVMGWARAHLAVNWATRVRGTFQVHPIWYDNDGDGYDPSTWSWNPHDKWANVRFAARLSSNGYDWSHWACKP